MPAGPTRSPRRIPFHVAVILVPRFPEREIADVLLVIFVVLYAPGRSQFIEVEVRKLSVTRKLVDPIINGFVVSLICETFCDQSADHGDHFVDVRLLSRRG